MSTQINSDNISDSGRAYLIGPRVSSIQITNSSYVVLDDTSVSTGGGYIRINGSNFLNGCQVKIGSLNATSVSFVSANILNVQVPAQSAGTYIVYVINGDGGYAIIVNGLTYSGTPTWVTGSTLPDGYTAEPISIQLSATGDAPLIYALQSGSTLPSGLTLTSGGLLSGTVTVESATTYNFTIEAIDAQAQESPRAFQISIAVVDIFFEYVSLLMPGTSTSYTTRDASTNNFQITIVQDSKSSAFNPFTTNWGNYFDGNGDNLTTVANTAFAFAKGDLTVEMWIYPTTTITSPANIGLFYIEQTDGLVVGLSNGNLAMGSRAVGYAITTSYVPPVGAWTHVAVTRSGATAYIFANGTQVGTVTASGGDPNNNSNYVCTTGLPTIAGNYAGGAGFGYFTGYISNLRVLKGTALYTSNFTPPTSNLTNITNTSLLTCQSNRFIDNSTNNFAITANGNTTVSAFAPFTNEASNNGSIYFDGASDYLTAPNTSANFGTGDFTIELWFFKAGSGLPIISNQDGGTDNNYFVLDAANAQATFQIRDNSSQAYAYGPAIVNNTWNHIAVSRASGSVRVFVNGVSGTPVTITKSITSRLTIIGAFLYSTFEGYFTGYISNLRILKGTALYTTNFTPPTTPLTAIANTSLLTVQSKISANNNSFVDDSGTNTLLTRFGNITQGSFNPYGPAYWSVYFDGAAASNISLTQAAYNPNVTGTVEFFCLPFQSGSGSGLSIIFGNGSSGDIHLGFNANNTLSLRSFGGFATNGTIPLTIGRWNHVAITHNSSTDIFTIYVNGVLDYTTTQTASFLTTGTFRIGSMAGAGSSFGFPGYISNFRITTTIVYTTNFTPPTTPLTAIAGTTLLTCQSYRYVDASTNNYTITRNGGLITNFSPFNPSGSYSTSSYSGCLFFDGNGDQVTASPTFLGLSNPTVWTIEGWFYPTSFRNTNTFISIGTGGSIIYWLITVGNASGFVSYSNGSGGWGFGTTYTSTVAMQLNAWNHVAIVRNGTTLTFYINGVSGGTNTGATFAPAGTGGTAWIGSYYNNHNGDGSWWGGYACDVRINVGQAVYNTSFTPPTTPLTANQNTVLLLNGTEGGLIDAAAHAPMQSFNQAGLSPARSKFGNGSMYFDGTNDYLMAENIVTDLYAFGSGDFTIEMWIYINSFPGAGSYIVFYDSRPTSTNGAYNTLTLKGSTMVYYANTADRITSGTLSINTWYFIAVTRSGTNTRLFIDGTQVGSTYTDSTAYLNPVDRPIIGGDGFAAASSFNGYMNDLRITKGIARYTTTFTPPTTPFLTR